MGRNHTHDRLIDLVFGRLCENGYASVIKKRGYNSSYYHEEGEFDILAIKANNEAILYAVIVEVKSSKHGRSYKKAREQLEKHCKKVREMYGPEVRCFQLFIYQNKHKLKRGLYRPYFVEWLRGCTRGA